MQRRFRQFYTALREHSSVSYAKIATVGGFCNVERLIIKATAPHDLPLPEKYIQELLTIFSLSPSSLRQFSLSFTRRFGKTHCWRVALKCLILLHRLLRAVPEDSDFRSELLWMRSNGLMTLNQCHFRDDSSSASEDYTAFIRSYAQLLDEALHCFWLDNHPTYNHQQHQQDQELQLEQEDQESEEYEDEQEEHQELVEPQFESLSNRMTEVEIMLEVLPQLQSLIDLVMDCRPTGPADKAYLVQLAMKLIIRDSFMCYTIFRREIVLVLDSLFQMPYRSCISAFGVYKKAAVQANQLCEFYEWCKAMGFCGSFEYPFIDQIPQIQIHALQNCLNGMWQLKDQSSSTPTSPTSSASTLSSFVEYSSSTEDDAGERLIGGEKDHVLVTTKWEKSLIQFEGRYCDEETPLIQLDYDDLDKPLFQFEDDDVDESWESLLEASIDMPHAAPQQLDLLCSGSYGHFDYRNEVQCQGQKDRWQMQVYDSGIALNPFYQPAIRPDYNELSIDSNLVHGDYNICYTSE